MRRTLKISGQRRFLDLVVIFMMILLVAVYSVRSARSGHEDPLTVAVLWTLWLLAAPATLLHLMVTRVIVADDRLERWNMFNRKKWSLPYREITAYTANKHRGWSLSAGEIQYKLPEIDFHSLHVVLADKAPKALNAKRWKCGQLPPSEDFKSLSLFDGRYCASSILGSAMIGGILFLILRSVAVLGVMANSILDTVYQMRDIFGELSLTTEGIELNHAWHKRRIAWDDVRAVFCEVYLDRRSFVATTSEASIAVPPHIARDLEIMRKFFYSLPEGALMVNFDKSWKTGYRRRRGKKIYAGELPTPALFDPLGAT